MSEHVDDNRTNSRIAWVAIGLVVVVALILLILLQPGAANANSLKPIQPVPTPGTLVVNGQASLVTFEQLNDEPLSFLNRTIRVTGDFAPLDLPACRPYSGPRLRWSLIASDLQLDARGYETVARLIPRGLSLTVEGVWRRYQGPLGCGKEPETGTAWFLEVTRIVQPNPLPAFAGELPGDGPAAVGTPVPGTDSTPDALATATPTPSPTLTTTAVFTTPTATVGPSPTARPTEPLLPSPTPDPGGGYPGDPGDPGGGYP
ncbi:MAG: hypothetical protein KC425_12290 [Anaerolineales bacterium]|nr:hypothetical protein [Anaerolineales bacterium]